MSKNTAFPLGKHRQKKSGRGRPTASFIASVRTEVMSTEYSNPEQSTRSNQSDPMLYICQHNLPPGKD